MSILQGWSGKLTRYYKEKIGVISIKIEDLVSEVYFDTSVLRINGNKCSERGHLHSYLKIGNMVHFNAEKMRKPFYEIGPHVWFKADLVWVGQKPPEADLSDDSEGSIGPDDADVFGHYGEVAKIVNKSTAVLKSKIENKMSLVAIERCRLYLNGKECSNNIGKNIKLGDRIFFEAFQLKPKHPSGIEYHASAAWTIIRPNLNFSKPEHPLNIPSTPLFPQASTSAGGAMPSTSTVPKKDKSTSTRVADIPAQPSTSSAPNSRGIVGRVISLPNASIAVLISEIEDRTALVALDRCRFFIRGRMCPSDIRTVIQLGDIVRFEAIHIGVPHPSGIAFRAKLAWLGYAPHLDLPLPSHTLDLPHELVVNLPQALQLGLLKANIQES